MDHDSSTDSGLPIDGSPPSEAWLFAQVLYDKPLPRIVSPEAKARAKREELERLAPFSTRHAEELRGLQAAEAAEREAWRRAERFVEAHSTGMTEWDEADHPRAPKGQSDGGQWVAKDGSGSAQHSDHSGAAGEPKVVDQHTAPAQMLELANAWWQTNNLLRQCHRDLEQLPPSLKAGSNNATTRKISVFVFPRDLEVESEIPCTQQPTRYRTRSRNGFYSGRAYESW